MPKYPKTAEEYAKQVGGGLATDPEFWASSEIHTGEDLARELAISSHSDTYKELNGIRPRFMRYDEMSIEEIEAETQQLIDQDMEEFGPDPADAWLDPLADRAPPGGSSERYRPFEQGDDWEEDAWHRKGGPRGPQEGVHIMTIGDIRSLVKEVKNGG